MVETTKAMEDVGEIIREFSKVLGIPKEALPDEIEIVIADSVAGPPSGEILMEHPEDGVGSEDEDPLIV